MEDDTIPAWARGPDCFENDQHRRDVEVDHFCEADQTILAYSEGSLHILANAIEEFQHQHRMLFRQELEHLHSHLVDLINYFDRRSFSPHFPRQVKPTHSGHSA